MYRGTVGPEPPRKNWLKRLLDRITRRRLVAPWNLQHWRLEEKISVREPGRGDPAEPLPDAEVPEEERERAREEHKRRLGR